jgi:hypothetical protein
MSYSYNSFLPLPQYFSYPFHSLKYWKMLTYFGPSPNMDWCLLDYIMKDWNNMTDTWLTVKEVAQYLKLSPDLMARHKSPSTFHRLLRNIISSSKWIGV